MSVPLHVFTKHLASPGAVKDLAGQLATRGVNIVSPGFSNRGNEPARHDDVLEFPDPFFGGATVSRSGKRSEGDQVQLARKSPEKFNELPGVFGVVIHAVYQRVLERHRALVPV